MIISVPASIGELFDKITILELKINFIADEKKLDNVRKEHSILISIANAINYDGVEILDYKKQLYEVNAKIWTIEDQLREKETLQEFDDDFISIVRNEYKLNDLRSKIKKEINIKLNSEIVEEKSYKESNL